MTQLVTEILALSPATPGQAPANSRVDGAATGSFAHLLSDAALRPDTLAGKLETRPAALAALEGAELPVTLIPADVPVAAEAALLSTGQGGEPLPAAGNALPLTDASLMPEEAPTLAALVQATADGEDSAELAAELPVADLADPAPDNVDPAADLLAVAVPVPNPAEQPVAAATDLARNAVPTAVAAETTARAARGEAALPERAPGTPPAVVDDAPVPAASADVAAKAAAVDSGAEIVARPETVARAVPVDGAAGSAGQDLLARLAPLETASTHRPTPVESTVRMTIDQPVTSPGWADALSRRVLVMTDTQMRSAEIRMDPPELGPIEVQLTVRDEKAHVTFQAQHALTREAIESAMPRLREMLAEQGLALGQATVSDQSAGESGRYRQDGADPAVADGSAAGEADATDAAPAARLHAGLIDEYA